MNKKATTFFIKYTCEKPFLFFLVVGVGVFFVLYLSLTIKTDVIKTYNGMIKGNTVYIEQKITDRPSEVYLYNDRNEAVYRVSVEEAHIFDDGTYFLFDEKYGFSNILDTMNVKIDVPVRQMSLFERIFLKGGKINNE